MLNILPHYRIPNNNNNDDDEQKHIAVAYL